jgi:hypothetical protein
VMANIVSRTEWVGMDTPLLAAVSHEQTTTAAHRPSRQATRFSLRRHGLLRGIKVTGSRAVPLFFPVLSLRIPTESRSQTFVRGASQMSGSAALSLKAAAVRAVAHRAQS